MEYHGNLRDAYPIARKKMILTDTRMNWPKTSQKNHIHFCKNFLFVSFPCPNDLHLTAKVWVEIVGMPTAAKGRFWSGFWRNFWPQIPWYPEIIMNFHLIFAGNWGIPWYPHFQTNSWRTSDVSDDMTRKKFEDKMGVRHGMFVFRCDMMFAHLARWKDEYLPLYTSQRVDMLWSWPHVQWWMTQGTCRTIRKPSWQGDCPGTLRLQHCWFVFPAQSCAGRLTKRHHEKTHFPVMVNSG